MKGLLEDTLDLPIERVISMGDTLGHHLQQRDLQAILLGVGLDTAIASRGMEIDKLRTSRDCHFCLDTVPDVYHNILQLEVKLKDHLRLTVFNQPYSEETAELVFVVQQAANLFRGVFNTYRKDAAGHGYLDSDLRVILDLMDKEVTILLKKNPKLKAKIENFIQNNRESRALSVENLECGGS